jgi:hypothetical protein
MPGTLLVAENIQINRVLKPSKVLENRLTNV